MEHDGTRQWQLWVPTNKWQKGPEQDFVQWEWCHEHQSDILHWMTSEVLTLQHLQHDSTECRSLKHMGLHSRGHSAHSNCPNTHTQTHTQRQGHHTTCLNFCTDKSAVEARTSEPLKKSFLTASSSFWVSSSILLMSSIVSSIHLSIQQKSWRWKLVNILFSCFKKINKH